MPVLPVNLRGETRASAEDADRPKSDDFGLVSSASVAVVEADDEGTNGILSCGRRSARARRLALPLLRTAIGLESLLLMLTLLRLSDTMPLPLPLLLPAE